MKKKKDLSIKQKESDFEITSDTCLAYSQSTNITKNVFGNKERFYFKEETPCIKHYGFGHKHKGILSPRIDYLLTNLALGKDEYFNFELWDNQGYIATYQVKKEIFERNAVHESRMEEYFKKNELNQSEDIIDAYRRILSTRFKKSA